MRLEESAGPQFSSKSSLPSGLPGAKQPSTTIYSPLSERGLFKEAFVHHICPLSFPETMDSNEGANNTDMEAPGPETNSSTKPKPAFIWKLHEHLPPTLLRKVIAEAIATFLLVFVTCGSAAMSVRNEGDISKLGASVAGGLIVTVMIYAVGHISGAHMNPAVTFAFAAVRHFPWKQVPFYMAAQMTGSIIASFILRELLSPITNIGTTTPSGTNFQAFVMEVVVTFSMMFVTSAVATDTKAIGELAGIAVGSAVTITSILAGPISGGSMNPARTIGPAIASKRYKGVWVYIVGPMVGTLLGSWSYNFIRASASESESDDKALDAISEGSSCCFKLRHRRHHYRPSQERQQLQADTTT